MKIFIGGYAACDVHNEKYLLKEMCQKYDQDCLTDNYQEADLIIIMDTCSGSFANVLRSLDVLAKVCKNKKENAEVILSGCLVNGLNCGIPDEYKEMISQVKSVNSKYILEYIRKYYLMDIVESNIKIPYSYTDKFGINIRVSPVSGCLNNCSFCKKDAILKFPLHSHDFKDLQSLASEIDEAENIRYISLFSSNLSLYGVDKYGIQRAHEVIDLLTSSSNIQYASVGALINWYPELLNTILSNEKIKKVYASLESGSERIYNLMNRPISLAKLKEILKTIKRERPDIQLCTEIISGFPTETMDDLKRSIELIYELELYPTEVWPYDNSPTIASAKHPQYSYENGVYRSDYAIKQLLPLIHKLDNQVYNGEMYVLAKGEIGPQLVYITLLTDGNMRRISAEQLDREYTQGDIILPGKVKDKHLVRHKKNI